LKILCVDFRGVLILSNILKSINSIEKFTQGFTAEKFLETEMEQFKEIEKAMLTENRL